MITHEPLKLPGKITISRSQGPGPDEIHIMIEDDVSATRVLELRMTPEEYGYAISGLAYRPCQLEVYKDAPLGKKHEHKTELLPVEAFLSRSDEAAIEAALKPFEVDGWRAYRGDIPNAHRWVRMQDGSSTAYRVSFHRYV